MTFPTKRATVARRAVPFLDISRENSPLTASIQAAIEGVCESGAFVLGPECRQLEDTVARISGVPHGIGCASGSDALLLSLMALDIGPGDEVIVPSFTFFATASAVSRLGAKPVFVDIDPRTYNIDPQEFAAAITPATKAVIPVHLFGQPADMNHIMTIAEEHQVYVIEDAAQAIGAVHLDRPVGSWGHIGCISFYPTKNLGGFGDSGMMVTADDKLAERLRLLRVHGMKPRYVHREVGINSRLDSIQAAVLNVKLQSLNDWTNARRENAERYMRMFSTARMSSQLTLPSVSPESHHVWNQFTIRVHDGMRDALREYLNDQKVGTEIYYPIPLHLQACFADLGYREGSLPHTEQAAREVLNLPIFPMLTEDEQETVVHHSVQFFASEVGRLTDYRPAA